MPQLGQYHYLFQVGNSERTLLLLHGTGGDEHDLLPLAKAIDVHANILSVRGNVDEHGYNRFFKRLDEGVYDLADLEYRTQQLAEFIQLATDKHELDSSQLVLAGYSNGANIGLNLLLHQPDLIQQAVLLRPLYPLEINADPKLNRLNLLILFGQDDPIAGQDLQPNLVPALQQAGVKMEVHHIPAGHELTNQDIAHIQGWLTQK